jgi:hypothetical protein
MIRSTYEKWTPEDISHGEPSERDWLDDEGYRMEPDALDQEEGLSRVDLAVQYLVCRGACLPSQDPPTGAPDLRFSTEPVIDFKTGTQTIFSYHLEGFSCDEQLTIYRRLKHH